MYSWKARVQVNFPPVILAINWHKPFWKPESWEQWLGYRKNKISFHPLSSNITSWILLPTRDHTVPDSDCLKEDVVTVTSRYYSSGTGSHPVLGCRDIFQALNTTKVCQDCGKGFQSRGMDFMRKLTYTHLFQGLIRIPFIFLAFWMPSFHLWDYELISGIQKK